LDTTELINKKISAVFASYPQRSLSAVSVLRRDNTLKLRRLRKHCRTCAAKPYKTPSELWLTENYYLLERESKTVQQELLSIQKSRLPFRILFLDAVPALSRIFTAFFGSGTPAVAFNEENLRLILEAASDKMELTTSELVFAPLALRLCLIERAFHAFFDSSSPEEDVLFSSKALHDLYTIDFLDIAAAVSPLEKLLFADPADIYRIMDDDSRAYYRHLLTLKAAKEKTSETDAARHLLKLAQSAQNDRERHIGYWLLKYVCRPRRRGTWLLLLPVLCAVVLAVFGGIFFSSPLFAVISFLPLWETLRELFEWLFTRSIPADVVPAIDLKRAVCTDCETVVAVTTLIPKVQDIPKTAAHLKKLRLANELPGLHFCLLADFKESTVSRQPNDDAKLSALVKAVDSLNVEFNGGFSLFVRDRTYCRTQGKYCGRERKRGAITDFVRYIRGENPPNCRAFSDFVSLRGKKNLIILDADTNLLFDTAEKMIGAARHPLNRPVIDPVRNCITDGYGILVPRLSVSLESANATFFSQIMAGCGGTIPYDIRSKDFYQDFFGLSLFSGKGIIDIEAFAAVMDRRLPPERILSHDVIEGEYLHTGFLSQVELSESFPATPFAWHARLHRWVRGDWQNLFLLARKDLSLLSKYKLFDNLRRSLLPVASLFCIVFAAFAAFFGKEMLSHAAAVTAWIPLAFTPFLRTLLSLVGRGFSLLTRRYFSDIIPQCAETLCRIFVLFIQIPYTAFVTLNAIFRALWRSFVTKKLLLQWVTAADSSFKNILSASFHAGIPALLLGLLLLLSPSPLLRLYAIFFLSAFPVTLVISQRRTVQTPRISAADREYITDCAARIWSFFEEYAAAPDNWLPPDNVQQAPVYAVAHRTSPTNIGLCLLSALAARDLDFIDSSQLYHRLSHTLATIEKLEKWHGNLFNWYDTVTLEVLSPAYVSAVDSGNFLCCLVALKEGLREYSDKTTDFSEMIFRIEQLLADTDIAAFYHPKRRLFSIGYDPNTECFSESFYDFLMSEARMTSYYAIAARRVEKRHWASLSRTLSRSGSYAGPVSWTGTMFEYYMPALLLPNRAGSLLSEALKYSCYCQRKRVKKGTPWGISESAFYSFDRQLCYQYKAHGVQKLGVKRGLDAELVISPYSTFLALPFFPNSSIKNLKLLQKLGMFADYGFFEALDLTPNRSGICRSYMSHHLGMSMIACCNALFGGIMQRRFLSDPQMNSAQELLEERPDRDTVVFEDIKFKDINETLPKNRLHQPGKGNAKMNFETLSGSVDLNTPHVTILSNGELCDILCDSGENRLMLAQSDITRRTTDSLCHPQGIFAFACCGGKVFSFTEAPFYEKSVVYHAEISRDRMRYLSCTAELSCCMEVSVHDTLPVEQRTFSIKNISDSKQSVELLIYFEPVLQIHRDYEAHPAFSKLFVAAEHDSVSGCTVFSRRPRGNERPLSLAVGFLEHTEFETETRREKLFTSPFGFESLKNFVEINFRGGKGIPDCCFAAKLKFSLSPGQRISHTLFLSAASRKEECTANLVNLRLAAGIKTGRNAAVSPIFNSTLEGRIAFSLLPNLLYPTYSARAAALSEKNLLGIDGLWSLSLSGDFPILLYHLPAVPEEAADCFCIQLRVLKLLRECRIEFDLVVLFSGEALPGFSETARRFAREHGCSELLGSPCGLFCIDSDLLTAEQLTLLQLVAACSLSHNTYNHESSRKFSVPQKLYSVSSADIEKVMPRRHTYGGLFTSGRFYSTRATPLPYCHVLASPTFGTVVSDNSLGFTWAVNSRENKLTPWSNDFATDNHGEMLVMKLNNGQMYSLTRGALFSCSEENARWEGYIDRLKLCTEISLPPKGAKTGKVVEVVISNMSDRDIPFSLAYYTEPILSAGNADYTMKGHHYLKTSFSPGMLTVENPMNQLIPGVMALSCSSANCYPVWDRAAFLSGNWSEQNRGSELCAALALSNVLPAKKELRLRFMLTFAAKPAAARLLASEAESLSEHAFLPLRSFEISTPDEQLDIFINSWCPHQAREGRIFARTSFWQNGGAYGFRDQLQDAICLLSMDPVLLKRQIFRACAVQFTEGDVLHWWHRYPNAIRGVRTRISDDLLWLPYAVCEYIEKTGDTGILQTRIAYLEGAALAENERERYFEPARSKVKESVYQHCLRVLGRFGIKGEHGLPLIGTGDWNDSFNSVGAEGKGESVWLAMFLRIVSLRFASIAAGQGDSYTQSSLELLAEQMKQAVETHCWDGKWYLRAFCDDGSVMGSSSCSECRIDSLAQSFAALSDISDDPARIDTALNEALDRLFDRKSRILRLFTPPFESSAQSPGYVKAYPAGIRENGGQYTHAAIWLAMALLKQNRCADGYRILEMLNPVSRCSDYDLNRTYLLEPYLISADIYAGTCPGRGGWSMYTGAAGWYFRTVLEKLLGLRIRAGKLYVQPHIPDEWNGFSVIIRTVDNGEIRLSVARTGMEKLTVDGSPASNIPLDGSHDALLEII